MGVWTAIAIATGAVLLAWLLAVAALVALGRRSGARALAGFLPDCAVLVRRLAADPRVPRRSRALLVAAGVYLALPIDLVPDFIPVAGQLDDAIVVGLVLRNVIRGAGPGVVEEHWPGPASSRAVVLRLAGSSS
ncbi:MAG: hypothetical protein QOK31_1912 [Solirubrobacteraceae bacterium]|jgi:uncharacterized membrane protein YkvA (DUF1232 family)|nr:hypothetical protein [Solirubrobacteraceae bacterium]